MVRAARIALALYLLAGAAITLGPTPDGVFGRGQRAVGEVTDGALSAGAIEAGANIAVFVPLGFLLCQAFPAVRRSLMWLLCVTASAGIEAYQYLLPGRDASVRDVVMNGLGAALGVLLSWVLDGVLARRRARSG
ncbi:VanZ family protein [Blastococcus sp. TF02A-26]|uniref:VanZ family protein n=1 Tax=Blastococcus sp. TF02A-26 TaxID=2250577 RepID=UPI000DEA7645|nr:VanZ family protein [Blastococcus sp. TF02A-26]RBY87414.1 VanZ family protein [Blastococcus sp. TF02A-26]